MPMTEKEKLQKTQEKFQAILSAMLRDDDNKYCVDCDAKGPRWASWNLGIFLCIRCAGIHRNLGVHISRVKSVNLDQWTGEQIASVQAMGNSKARAVYEANLPDNYKRPQTDSPLEQFIRAKYEQRKWIAKEWMPPNISTLSTDFNEDEPVVKVEKKKEISKPPQKIELEKKVMNLKPKSEAIKQQPPVAVEVEKKPETNIINFFDIDDVPPQSGPILQIQKQQPEVASIKENAFFNTNDSDFNGLSFSYAQTETNTNDQHQSSTTSNNNEQLIINNNSSNSLNEDIKLITGKKAPIDKNSILALYKNNPSSSTNSNTQANLNNNSNTLAMQNPVLNMQQAQIQSSQYYPGNNTMTFTAPTMNHPQMPQPFANNPQMYNRMPMMYNNQQNNLSNVQQQMSNLNLGQQQQQQQQTNQAWSNQASFMMQNQWPNQMASANNNNFNFNMNQSTAPNSNSQNNTMSSNLWQ